MKDRARMIFALIGGLLFIILKAIFPDLPFTEDQTIVFVGILCVYIIGEGLEGNRIADNLKAVLKSQKFQALVAGLIVVTVKSFFPNLPITDQQLTEIITILSVLILGAGVQGAISNVTSPTSSQGFHGKG
jgi:uncharacterized membrane protein YdjX (TVP38/TMEM64 family)